MKQKVVRTDNSSYSNLEKLLKEGYVVTHITPIGNKLEYIVTLS